jgi:hypothetical protein
VRTILCLADDGLPNPNTSNLLDRGLFRLSGAFSRRQYSAAYTTSMFGFDFLQVQAGYEPTLLHALERNPRKSCVLLTGR